MAKKTPRAARASKSRARKRAPVPKKTPNRRRAPGRQREQTGANDPLFVPHPRALAKERLARSAAADPYSALLETICGATDDSQAVEQYNGTLGVTAAFVAAHQSAACQVQWNDNLASIYTNPGDVSGARWGSGTMITNDLFLTCGHLFDQAANGWELPRVNGTNTIIPSQEIARNMHLNFNFQVDGAGNPRPEQSFPITQLIEFRLGGLDMAVCRIGGDPGGAFGQTQLSATDAAVGDMICIIGHPAGQRKRIEAGPTTAIQGNLITYNDIDTLGGNSGSGILRAGDGRLVGIHTNGGCNPQGGSNFGQRIAAVIAASPTLQAVLNTPAAIARPNTDWVTSWGQNRLDIFGLGTDGAMYHKAWDGASWRPTPVDWERLGGVFTSPPAVAAWGNNRLDIFGLGTDGAMYHKAWDGAAWRPSPLNWERLGGIFTSPPAVVAWGPNRLDIFGIGADGAMYHKAWDGAAWRPSLLDWDRLGGVFTSPPAVAAWGNNRLDIFGLGTDGAVYHKAWDGAAWRPTPADWERLGGVFTSPPVVTAWGQNRLDIFGLGTDGAVYHKAWDGGAWRPSPLNWERLGGVFTSPLAVSAWGQNRLDIFGLGTDGAMYHKAWDGAAWRPSPLNWERLGGVFSSAPGVTAWGQNRLDVFGLGMDGAMYHKAWDGAAWRPSPLDWERLGGVFTSP